MKLQYKYKSKFHKALLVFCVFIILGLGPIMVAAKNNGGLILLQVEARGEAWYINPVDGKRYSLGQPSEALAVLRKLGLGVEHQVIVKPPTRLFGRIVIDVYDLGKAYYLNPNDHKVYYLGQPAEVLKVMGRVGVGASNKTIYDIPLGDSNSEQNRPVNRYESMEKTIQELVNEQRQKNGLASLKWNEAVAAVARKHSQDQAVENAGLIEQGRYCSYPFIHHEGMVFGLYHADRLHSQKIYYESASAENIALIPKIKSVQFSSPAEVNVDCQDEVNTLNVAFEKQVKSLTGEKDKVARLKKEISTRTKLLKASPQINVIKSYYNDQKTVENKAVVGWMNSPGHKKNILNADYDEAGMGIAEVKGYYIITQVFIKRANCGYKDGACCQKTDFLPYCYVPWTCNEAEMCQ